MQGEGPPCRRVRITLEYSTDRRLTLAVLVFLALVALMPRAGMLECLSALMPDALWTPKRASLGLSAPPPLQ